MTFRQIQGIFSNGIGDVSSSENPPLQVGVYGKDTTNTLHMLDVDTSGHLKITLQDWESDVVGIYRLRDTTNSTDSISVPSNGTGNSISVDMNGFSVVSFFGTAGNTSDGIHIEYSHNNSTWYKDSNTISVDFTTGNFHKLVETGARYVRISQTDSTSTATTITLNISQK